MLDQWESNWLQGELVQMPPAADVLFHCDFAQEVWRLTPIQNLEIPANTSLLSFLSLAKPLRNLPPTGLTGGELYPWICWNLWTARNAKIFSENQVSESEVVLKAVRGAREWQAAQALLPTSLNVNRAQVPQIEMEDFRGFRVFVDAAWNPSSRSGGFGWTFVNASNTSQENFSEANDSITSALVAEAEALLSALKHAL